MWSSLTPTPPDPVFGLAKRCKDDTDPHKVDLVIGSYRDEAGKPYLLNVVAKVEEQLAKERLDREYLDIDGHPGFRKESVRLLLGDDSIAVKESRVAAAQALSGTGALRLAFEFYRRNVSKDTPVYFSDPTWANHPNIATHAGFENVCKYRYFDNQTKGVDFVGMLDDLKAAADKSIVCLQLCAHNPTGADPTREQWQQLAELCKSKQFIVIFDSAYQGYATGDLDNDAYPARLFDQNGLEFATAQSFSKNFGLYAERIGCLSFVTSSSKEAEVISTHLKTIIRPMYSNPPIHGARVVHRVLSTPELRAEWIKELRVMSNRIISMRELLYKTLKDLGCPGAWDHIVSQIGMFSYTGLTREQCDKLITDHHIYLLGSGRISIPGLCTESVPRVAKAIAAVVTQSRM